jgi:pimeloyl-ACP methyl ester carboxylesterase
MPRQRYSGVTDFGGTGKTIILLHGFLASSKYWQKLQPFLSRSGYRVITIDLLGFGRAPKPSESSYSYDEHVAYVHQVIARQKLDEPYIMVGHSMGALIAARYEALHSSEVASLILLHPPLYKDKNQAQATLRRTGKLYRFLLDSRFRRLGWMLIKTICFEYVGNHSRAARERSMRNVIEKAEILTDLRRTDSKTLLLVGLRDREEYLHNLNVHQLSTAITARTEDVTHHSPIQSTQLIYYSIHQFVTSTT